jgi:hypothetical protein
MGRGVAVVGLLGMASCQSLASLSNGGATPAESRDAAVDAFIDAADEPSDARADGPAAPDGARDAAQDAGTSDASQRDCPTDCLGGACKGGVCQPVTLASDLAQPFAIVLDSANVYWTTFSSAGSVMRVGKDGSNLTTLAKSIDPWGIAVSSGYVYWAETGGGSAPGIVHRVLTTGGPVEDLAAFTAPEVPAFVQVDAQNYFVATFTNDTGTAMSIYACPLAGTCVPSKRVTIAMGLPALAALTIDSNNVYWVSTDGQLGQCPKTGCASPASPMAIANLGSPARGLALTESSTNLFVSSFQAAGSIDSVALGAATPFATAQAYPVGVTVDATNVYWIDEGPSDTRSGSVMKCGIASCTTPTALVTGETDPSYLAVDDVAVYWITGQPNVSSGTVRKVAK